VTGGTNRASLNGETLFEDRGVKPELIETAVLSTKAPWCWSIELAAQGEQESSY